MDWLMWGCGVVTGASVATVIHQSRAGRKRRTKLLNANGTAISIDGSEWVFCSNDGRYVPVPPKPDTWAYWEARAKELFRGPDKP
jgi:hypothetical protein